MMISALIMVTSKIVNQNRKATQIQKATQTVSQRVNQIQRVTQIQKVIQTANQQANQVQRAIQTLNYQILVKKTITKD